MPPVTLTLDGKTTVIRHTGITPVPVRVCLSQGGYWPAELRIHGGRPERRCPSGSADALGLTPVTLRRTLGA